MNRRDFLKDVAFTLAGVWAAAHLPRPRRALAQEPEFRLALLADAHLKNGDDTRPEARALARAVADIRAWRPAPDLVLFAGDLAHRGRPDALDLGREILADLPAPLLAVQGEGDVRPGTPAAWTRRFGPPRFSQQFPGFHLLGLDTGLRRASAGWEFALGAEQIAWLARELPRLDPALPLLILSHAPLTRIFHPWQQWTADSPELHRLLQPFGRVLCLHGHTHYPGVREQGAGVSNRCCEFSQGEDCQQISFTANLLHLSLPATAWPRPLAIQGTPAFPRPGLGPQGCGWGLATLSDTSRHFQPYLWQA